MSLRTNRAAVEVQLPTMTHRIAAFLVALLAISSAFAAADDSHDGAAWNATGILPTLCRMMSERWDRKA